MANHTLTGEKRQLIKDALELKAFKTLGYLPFDAVKKFYKMGAANPQYRELAEKIKDALKISKDKDAVTPQQLSIFFTDVYTGVKRESYIRYICYIFDRKFSEKDFEDVSEEALREFNRDNCNDYDLDKRKFVKWEEKNSYSKQEYEKLQEDLQLVHEEAERAYLDEKQTLHGQIEKLKEEKIQYEGEKQTLHEKLTKSQAEIASYQKHRKIVRIIAGITLFGLFLLRSFGFFDDEKVKMQGQTSLHSDMLIPAEAIGAPIETLKMVFKQRSSDSLYTHCRLTFYQPSKLEGNENKLIVKAEHIYRDNKIEDMVMPDTAIKHIGIANKIGNGFYQLELRPVIDKDLQIYGKIYLSFYAPDLEKSIKERNEILGIGGGISNYKTKAGTRDKMTSYAFALLPLSDMQSQDSILEMINSKVEIQPGRKYNHLRIFFQPEKHE